MTTSSNVETQGDPIGNFFDSLQQLHGGAAGGGEGETQPEPDAEPGDADAGGEGTGSEEGEAEGEGETQPEGQTPATFPEVEELISQLGDTEEVRGAVAQFTEKLQGTISTVVSQVRDEAFAQGMEAGQEYAAFYHANPELKGHEDTVQAAANEVLKHHASEPRDKQLKLVAEKAKARLNIVKKAAAPKAPAGGQAIAQPPAKPTTAEGQRQAGALELFEQLQGTM